MNLVRAFLAKGSEAVVASSQRVSDKAAYTFSKGFYSALRRGKSLEAAVSEGSKRVREQFDTEEWQYFRLWTQ